MVIMIADCYAVWDNFKNFIGGRAGILHWGIFCLALIYCLFLGKRDRKLLVWPTVMVLFFFFNPLFYRYVGSKFLSGVYWRLMWMVPVSFVTAYALVHFVYRFKKQAVRILASVLAVACIIVTGERMYQEKTFVRAENSYKLPQAVIDVADTLAAAGVNWKVRSLVPNELFCYIRQYRCDIGLFYGRNAGGFISEIGEDEKRVYDEMCKEEPDIGVITEICKRNEVVFLCFNRDMQRIPEDLEEYGYLHYRDVGEYSIYKLEEA